MTFKLKSIFKWAPMLLLGSATCLSAQYALAATEAGTQITNKATVSYEDNLGVSYTATSEDAIVTVAQIYSATIEADSEANASPGGFAYLQHTLTNTGNGADTYTLTIAQNHTNETNADATQLDATSIKIYEDSNDDGLPSAGETLLAQIPGTGPGATNTSVTIPGGTAMKLAVQVQVPSTAIEGNKIGLTLTAVANNADNTVVTDLTASKGLDTADGTNEDTVNVTNNAVIVLNKTATALPTVAGLTESDFTGLDVDGGDAGDPALNVIKYVVTATNTGNDPAKGVVLLDAIPDGAFLITGTAESFDYTPTSSGFVASLDKAATSLANIADETTVVNGAGTAIDINGDGDATDSGEAALDLDINANGNKTDATVAGIYAYKDSLSKSQTVTMTFYVVYPPALTEADTTIENTALICSDNNNDGDKADGDECPVTSNKTETKTESSLSALIDDTGAMSTSTDGGDFDTTLNDIQVVDSAPAGSTVYFYHLITNTGNEKDTYDIVTANNTSGGFPTGTIFSHMNGEGTAPITNTGEIEPSTCTAAATSFDGIAIKCNQKLIRVIATLPGNANGSTGYTATTTITSTTDNTITDTTESTLNTITAPTVDVANTPFNAGQPIDAATDVNPVNTGDGISAADVGTTFTFADAPTNANPLSPGDTVKVPLYIANEGGSPDSYDLTSGGAFDTGAWGAVPTGWSVQFEVLGVDTDADGTLDDTSTAGSIITSTQAIGGGSVLHLNAVITVSADAAQALANSNQAGAIDANADSDNDYLISFVATSQITGASNRKLDAFDIAAEREISISPTPLTDQIKPGGNVDFNQTLANTGNSTEQVTLGTTNTDPNFSDTLLIDTDGDGTPDTNVANLCTVAPCPRTITGNDGAVIEVELVGGVPALTLEPGESVALQVTVFAPANASNNQSNTTTITAENTDATGPDANSELTVIVSVGQIRLEKFGAVDTDCDGAADTLFMRNQTQLVEPTQCIIWKIVATNEGATKVMNISIDDEFTPFTAAPTSGVTAVGSAGLVSCINTIDTPVIPHGGTGYPVNEDIGELCTPTTATGTSVTESITGNSVKYVVSELASGDKMVVHFVAEVQ